MIKKIRNCYVCDVHADSVGPIPLCSAHAPKEKPMVVKVTAETRSGMASIPATLATEGTIDWFDLGPACTIVAGSRYCAGNNPCAKHACTESTCFCLVP